MNSHPACMLDNTALVVIWEKSEACAIVGTDPHEYCSALIAIPASASDE